MNAQEAVAYIRSYTWTSISLGLTRIQTLLEGLGNPQDDLKFIHVAGTNGKGSACAQLSSILEAAGYKTGLFTSPDLVRFTERMIINRQEISENDLARITEKVAAVADKMDSHPSEFELSTAIAFEYFREQHCDLVVLEVGMGGDLDSTNVITTTEAAILMNIGLDHTEYLGSTLPEIAATKAGIIKKDSSVIAYPVSEEVNQVYQEKCTALGASYSQADFSKVELLSRDADGQHICWNGAHEYTLRLPGNQQLHNVAVVLTTVEQLRTRGWNIPESAVEYGLANVSWPARFEFLTKNPYLIVDGSHNPQCVQALADNLGEYFPGRKFTFVTGVLADKDYKTMMSMVMPYAKKFLCVTPENPRALQAKDLAAYLTEQGACAESFDSYAEALTAAQIGKEDIVACGSLYMTGILRDMIIREYL